LKSFGFHGTDDERKFQRTASAPYVVSASNGLTVLPRDFDIFCFFASSSRLPTRMRLLAGLPVRNVASTCSV
jgi:hypothetical protein